MRKLIVKRTSFKKSKIRRPKTVGICKRCHARFYTEDSWEFHRTQYHLAQDEIPDSIRKLQKERFFKGVEG